MLSKCAWRAEPLRRIQEKMRGWLRNSGGIEAAHHVITEKGQEFSTGVAEKNAERLLKLCTDAVSWKGEKDSIKQAIFLRAGFHNSRATRPATRKMHAACSRDWMMKP